MNFRRAITRQEIIRKFNKRTKKDFSKEEIQKKLLDIQHYLLTVILEISSILPEDN